jgi:hypothetical protein
MTTSARAAAILCDPATAASFLAAALRVLALPDPSGEPLQV